MKKENALTSALAELFGALFALLFRVFWRTVPFWFIWRFWKIQAVLFVWPDDAAMVAHQFTPGQVVGEVWAATYFALAILMLSRRAEG